MNQIPENTTKKAGRTMMVLAWAVLLGLLITFFSHWEQQAYNPNASPTSTQDAAENTVTLQRNRYHHYVTTGTINDHSVVFLLDTGASDVVIPEALANAIGLSKGAAEYARTANGTITVYKTQLQQLTIGRITLHNISASINPAMKKYEGILLGMSALKNIEFTQRGDQLTLRQYR
jgi:aspartyl protease family protein